MKPTIEQITKILYDKMPITRREVVLECSQAIYDLMPLEREYKPLSEIAKSEEDCRDIFNFITKGYGETPITKIEFDEDYVLIESEQDYGNNDLFIRRVYIIYEGGIEHSLSLEFHDENEEDTYNEQPIDNLFKLIDFIRELGYDAK